MARTVALAAMLSIAIREYASFFRTPLGWVVVALFAFLSGVTFVSGVLVPGEPASLRIFFAEWWGLLVIVCPAISMRLLSEELRTGTLEPLLTSPRSEVAVALGKYAAAVAFFATTLAPTLLFVATIGALSRPEFGPIISGYLGLLLLASFYLAAGLLVSALTASQTLAFLGTLFALLLLEFGPARVAEFLPAPLDRLVTGFSANARMGDFAKGIIDLEHVGYFIAGSGWLVAMTALSLRIRRWR
ncbi:MAG: hypothetical protein ACT4PL_07300 [Phycisphaerales bacterium]